MRIEVTWIKMGQVGCGVGCCFPILFFSFSINLYMRQLDIFKLMADGPLKIKTNAQKSRFYKFLLHCCTGKAKLYFTGTTTQYGDANDEMVQYHYGIYPKYSDVLISYHTCPEEQAMNKDNRGIRTRNPKRSLPESPKHQMKTI